MTKKERTTTPAPNTLSAEQFLWMVLSHAEEEYDYDCDFAISAEYRRMLVTRKNGQQVEVDGLLVQLSTGMTVIITDDGDFGVTIEELTEWPTFLDETEEVQGREASPTDETVAST
jgi:hypothetical protein